MKRTHCCNSFDFLFKFHIVHLDMRSDIDGIGIDFAVAYDLDMF